MSTHSTITRTKSKALSSSLDGQARMSRKGTGLGTVPPPPQRRRKCGGETPGAFKLGVEEKQRGRLARRWSGDHQDRKRPKKGLGRAPCRGMMANRSHDFSVRGLSYSHCFACHSCAAVSKELSLVTCEPGQQQCLPQVL